jgi:hypothetical protein
LLAEASNLLPGKELKSRNCHWFKSGMKAWRILSSLFSLEEVIPYFLHRFSDTGLLEVRDTGICWRNVQGKIEAGLILRPIASGVLSQFENSLVHCDWQLCPLAGH